jgi:CheY-like chemotaxis protein
LITAAALPPCRLTWKARGDPCRIARLATVIAFGYELPAGFTSFLEKLGYKAIEVGDSTLGLKILQSDMRIDLLISDVGLPGGMNVRQMVDAGRVIRFGLKVLFITAYAENAFLGGGRLAPGTAVLTQPFPVETMAARIRSMIETKREELVADYGLWVNRIVGGTAPISRDASDHSSLGEQFGRKRRVRESL